MRKYKSKLRMFIKMHEHDFTTKSVEKVTVEKTDFDAEKRK